MKHLDLNNDKLKHCILFFLEKINNVHLGRIKLMKLLYYVDFDHYQTFGEPVTNALYRKLPHGPVAKDAEKLIKKMVANGELKGFTAERKDGKKQHRLVTLTAKFESSKFSGSELETLERVAIEWEHKTAGEIEAASHAEAPWRVTVDGKAIDYELSYYRKPAAEEEIDKEIAKSPQFRAHVNSLP